MSECSDGLKERDGTLFDITKLGLTIEMLDAGAPAGFWGARLRGLYGSALLGALCDHGPLADYQECRSFNTCPYPFLFESTVQARRRTQVEAPLTGDRLPPPFVFDAPFVPRTLSQGDLVSFAFVVPGSASNSVSVAVHSLARFGTSGFNIPGAKERVRYRLAGVRDLLDSGRPVSTEPLGSYVTRPVEEAVASANPESLPTELSVEFMSPTRIVNQNAPLLMPASRATLLTDFYRLVLNLCNRVGGLWQLYGEGWPGQAEFHRWRNQLLKFARDVRTIESRLAPFRDHRGKTLSHKSSRQNHERDLNGFVGTMRFSGDFRPFWTLLRVGEIVHIGNDTSSGLGQYRLVF